MTRSIPVKKLAAVALGLCIDLLFALGWYGTLPHNSRWPDFLSYLGFALAGVVVGWIEYRRFVFAAIMLALLLPPMSGVIHWGACHFNTQLDVCGFQAVMTLQVFLLPATIALCLLGAWLGAKLRR